MCFHSQQTKKAVILEKRYNVKIENAKLFLENAIYNGFTYRKCPVVSSENTKLIKHYQWGLIPFWAKDDSIKAYTLNAKIETIKEKPSFKGCIKNRCLVIVDGFYEWQWLDPKGKKKQKFLITFPQEELFSLGGIWSEWVDKSTGEIIKSYSIVTTEANDFMAEIHNNKKRMPVILKPKQEENWLAGEEINDFKKCNVDLKAVVKI